jgi:hypothetical protein
VLMMAVVKGSWGGLKEDSGADVTQVVVGRGGGSDGGGGVGVPQHL